MDLGKIPQSIVDRRAWRIELHRAAKSDKTYQDHIRKRCANDILFWLNAICWTFDPRRAEGDREICWYTYAFQDEVIPRIQAIMGKEDLGIEKSRTMTATWMILAVFMHQWQFRGLSALGLASAKEELVDKGPDPGSLFWKCRFLLRNQPDWMITENDYLDQKLILMHRKTRSTIKGYATTGDMGRSGRLLALMIDEYAAFEYADGYAADAATHAVTRCRIFNSTYKGASGCFYEKMRNERKKVVAQLSLPWWLHPEYSAGLYYDGRSKARSPWYDAEVKRLVAEQFVKSELDMDPMGSASQFFPGELLEDLLGSTVRKPYHVGRIEDGRFMEDEGGSLSLWMHPDPRGAAPYDERFAVGCDISMGTEASNSVASAGSQTTGEKVAELATSRRNPDQFARDTVDLCRWLNGAFLVWESNGPGGRFGKVVMEAGYRNIYYRTNEKSVSRKATDTPGWTATQDNKRDVYGAYITALSSGDFINRCKEAIEECRLITLTPTGKLENIKASAAIDPTGAGENHADRPTADALCLKGLRELGPRRAEAKREEEPNMLTLEGRRELRKREAAISEAW